MKKSISIWSFPGEWSLEKKMALAREAGFSGFEVDMTEDGPLNLNSGKEDVLAVRALADRMGLELSGLATGLYWGANGASADPAIREKAAFILKRQIEVAHQAGIDAALVVPASVGADFIPGCEIVPYETAWNRGRELIAGALPLAEELGVNLLVENVWNKFLLSPREFREFVDSFGSARVGAYFDVGNTLATGYPEDWIATLGTRIKRVHFKDYRRAVGSVAGFCDLLSGDVNWPDVVRALRGIEYDGWVAAEMIPPIPFYKHCPEVLVHNTSRAMDAIFGLC